jgi:DNA anti-recombination protein RmuC
VDDRRLNPGRRESDRVLDAIWRALSELKNDLRRDLESLEEDFQTFEEHVVEQIRALEQFHIEEQARAGERIVARAQTMARWTKASLAFGIGGVLLAAAEHFLG